MPRVMPFLRARYGARLDAMPMLAEFCEQAAAVIRADDPASFWRIQPPFETLLATDVAGAFVAHELTEVAGRPFHLVRGSSDFDTPLVECPTFALVLKLATPETAAAAPVITQTEHMLMAVVSGRAAVTRYALPPGVRNEVFDRDARLTEPEQLTLGPGDIARFEAPSTVVRLRVDTPAIVVQLQSATVASLRWVFHPQTLEPVRAAAARLSSSRLQFTCQTLAALGSPTSIPALTRLTTHPEHFVRWAAVQSICAISRDDGLACLRRAVQDEHPHVRRAAENTLGDHHSL